LLQAAVAAEEALTVKKCAAAAGQGEALQAQLKFCKQTVIQLPSELAVQIDLMEAILFLVI
jgi:hypothetical protein